MSTQEPAITFERTAALRREIAEVGAGLTSDQLSHPSLCGGWTVRDVLGHLVVPLTISLPRFGWAMVGARGNFDVANDRLARDTARQLGGEVTKVLRERASRRFVPPGGTPAFQLADVLVHSQDIRRPLGLTHAYAVEDLREVLGLLTSPLGKRGFVPSSRLTGLHLVATDTDTGQGQFTAGDGALVEGPAEAVILALTGRRVALEELTGPGVGILADRLPR
jgi:uncharacterized protein (TIGR03083 family)